MKKEHTPKIVWHSVPDQLTLPEDRVHVWRANLNLSTVAIDSLRVLLSCDECDRADRFRFPHHRRRFIAARGILRWLLGNYLQVDPATLDFSYSDRGKPSLKNFNNNSLQFNISHSEEYALYGFVYDRPIGVDIEHLKAMPDALKIARRYFTPEEYRLIHNVSAKRQTEIFFQLWTAKEAFLKAIGVGISSSLSSIEIAFDDINRAPICCLPHFLKYLLPIGVFAPAFRKETM